jgi:hypothetical protein
VAGYNVQLRKHIVDRWIELERAAQSNTLGQSVSVAEMTAEVRKVIGGIIKSVVHHEIAALLPQMVTAMLAEQNIMLRRGKTAGQLWNDYEFPKFKGIAVWFGNQLAKKQCQIDGNGRAEMGASTARLYDPDKARIWIESSDGRTEIDKKIHKRRQEEGLPLFEPLRLVK